MSANSADKITDTRNAARPNSARVISPRTSDGNSLSCDNLSGWPTVSKVHFVTYQIDSSSNPIAGTQLDCYGIVSGNSITSFTVVDGNDNGNSVNDVVEMLPTAAWGHDLFTALTNQHNQLDGSHHDITTDTITATGNASVGGTLGVTGISTLVNLVLNGSLTGTGLATQLQTQANAGSAGGTGYYINLGGIKLYWGLTAQLTTSGAAPQFVVANVNLPTGFFTTIQTIQVSATQYGATQYMYATTGGNTTSGTITNGYFTVTATMTSTGSNGTCYVYWFVIGT